MSDIAIKVEGLGKKYTILHEQGGGYRTLRETMASAAKAVAGRIRHPLTPYNRESAEEYWALKDINFEVKQGDRIGIIGRNGAGKSTLLKVLSRITEPSTGKVSINGRVASLLEVGTGFHPELSGRENIYLNGAILGMKRSEIKRKFDEIVEFAEVEKFLDTPVKRYSSGMYVRLAFAVAAHLEPEILVVDEVLAVGDAQFQKKCLGKMEDVSKNEGRTILFVSHNMAAVQQLCGQGLVMTGGQVAYWGNISPAISTYLGSFTRNVKGAESTFSEQPSRPAQMLYARLSRLDGVTSGNFECDESFIIEFEWLVRRRILGLFGYLSIRKNDSTIVAESFSLDVLPNPLDGQPPGRYLFKLQVPPRLLTPGEYEVYTNFASAQENPPEVHSPGVIARFSLSDSVTPRGNKREGSVGHLFSWNVKRND